MGALQSSHSLYIFTHDSIGLGEDGPTHQPIEHLMALRAIPQLTDFRPADANETAACWKLALERKSASFMALSRQDLPVLDAEKYKVIEGCAQGRVCARSLRQGRDHGRDGLRGRDGAEGGGRAEGCGHPRDRRLDAELQDLRGAGEEYKMSIFPHGVPKISVEAGATMGWWKYIGRDGIAIGLDRFGASAPGPIALEKLGISVAHVVEAAKSLVKK